MMKIVCIGGGPAGLYFGLLTKGAALIEDRAKVEIEVTAVVPD